MITKYKYLIILFLVLFLIAISGFVGYRVKTAECVEDQIKIANAYISNQNATVKSFQEKSEITEKKVAALRQKQNEAISRAEKLENELAKLPLRSSCDFNDDELRIFNSIYREYFPSDSSIVPSEMRESSRTE